MSRTVDYYFSCESPWTFIGHDVFMEIARRHALKVSYKPVKLGRIFAQTGGLPLRERPAVRQRYRMVELQRWRDKRGLTFNVRPKFWPFDGELLDRVVIAIVNEDGNPDPLMRAAFDAIWEDERNLADPAIVAELVARVGLDAPALLAQAQSPASELAYGLNYENALAADVFGAPAYVLDGEIFWGQDRLELLDDALTSGRGAYTSIP